MKCAEAAATAATDKKVAAERGGMEDHFDLAAELAGEQGVGTSLLLSLHNNIYYYRIYCRLVNRRVGSRSGAGPGRPGAGGLGLRPRPVVPGGFPRAGSGWRVWGRTPGAHPDTRPGVGWDCFGNGPGMGRERAGNGPGMGRERAGNPAGMRVWCLFHF